MTTLTRSDEPALTLRLPRPHSSQAQMYREARRFNVAACGRRFGKTTAGENRLIRPALDGYPVAWFAPTYKALTEVWREFRDLLQPVTASVDRQQHRIELVTRGVLEMWSLDSANAPRGRKYAAAVVDEAGFIPDLEYAWNAVIRPTLMDYRGAAWFLGTPKGMNYFHTLYQRGQEESDPEWASWQMPTAANPYIDPAEIEASRHEMPELTFAQEILAQFLPDGAGVFRRVRAACTLKPAEPEPGHAYVIGADWGQIDDYTVFSVMDAATRREVELMRFRRVEYTLAAERLWTLYQRWSPCTVVPELNSIGRPVIEGLARRNMRLLPFTMTNASKHDAVEAFAAAIERSEVELLDDPIGIAELEGFASERLPSGLLRYGAPEGMHDDTVVARLLAHHGAARPSFRPL